MALTQSAPDLIVWPSAGAVLCSSELHNNGRSGGSRQCSDRMRLSICAFRSAAVGWLWKYPSNVCNETCTTSSPGDAGLADVPSAWCSTVSNSDKSWTMPKGELPFNGVSMDKCSESHLSATLSKSLRPLQKHHKTDGIGLWLGCTGGTLRRVCSRLLGIQGGASCPRNYRTHRA